VLTSAPVNNCIMLTASETYPLTQVYIFKLCRRM